MMDDRRTEAEYIQWLAARHAVMARILQEHLADSGELIPHVLMADVVVNAAVLADRAIWEDDADDALNRLLDASRLGDPAGWTRR